jgi:uncharacterized membrane protein YkoI
MRKLATSILTPMLAAALLAGGLTVPVAAQQKRDEQGEVRKELDAGNVLPLRQIEQRVLPQMRGMQYLGPSYDSVAKAYRLKFIRDGRVVFVDVDARTGRILSKTN